MTMRMDLIKNHISEEQFTQAVKHICVYFDDNEIDYMGALIVLDIVSKVLKNELNISRFELMK